VGGVRRVVAADVDEVVDAELAKQRQDAVRILRPQLIAAGAERRGGRTAERPERLRILLAEVDHFPFEQSLDPVDHPVNGRDLGLTERCLDHAKQGAIDRRGRAAGLPDK